MTRLSRLLLCVAFVWPAWSEGQEPPKPKSDSNAERDFAVLEVVLKDLMTLPDSPLTPRGAAEKQIRFSLEALNDRLSVAEVLEQHHRDQWRRLSPDQTKKVRESAQNLVRRLADKDPFERFKPKDERIILLDKVREEELRATTRRSRRPQVFRAYAPGYSNDRRIAIVLLTYPWSGRHSGEGTYVLAKENDRWVVLLRDFVYHV